MKIHFAQITLLVLLLHSCTTNSATLQVVEEPTPEIPFTPQAAAQNLAEERIYCNYFVSPHGDDSMSGSESHPWGSFQYAFDSARPGDVVCFRGGRYLVGDTLHLTQSGTAESLIVFTAFPAEKPILDGAGTVGDLLVFNQHVSYVRFSGFTLRGFNFWGLDLNGDNRYIHLDHLTIEGGEAGLHFTLGEDDLAPPEAGPVEQITVEDSLISDSQFTGVDCTPGPCNNMIFRRLEVHSSGLTGESSFGADGIAVSRGYPVLVEDCFIHDNGGDGIDLNSRDRQGYAQGVFVRRNQVIRNHKNGIKLWAGGRIENNVVWGQGNSAVWVGTFHSNLEVVNNTFAYNMWDPAFSDRNWSFSAGYPEEIIPLPQVDLLLVNNIFAFNTGPQVGDPTGIYLGPGVEITEHHNLYFSSLDNEISADFLTADFSRDEIVAGSWSESTGQEGLNIASDPLFISGWTQVDLNLEPASPAIDAGDNASCPPEDNLGNPRLIDGDGDGEANCDIGAFEWRE
jgi:hypothetical protein